MLWAALVAIGVAIVTMTIFGARLTRSADDELSEDLSPVSDPDDPWAAWRPRPFEEIERRPRPRIWPVLAAMTGLVLVGGGFAGARQTFRPPETITASPASEPYLIEVEAPPTPTPTPTPEPTPPPPTPAPPASTPKPQVAAPAPTTAPTESGPEIGGTASCEGGRVRLTYNLHTHGSNLAYFSVYFAGEIVRGGPIGGDSHSGTYEREAGPGSHDLEVSAQDQAGKTARRAFGVRCS